MKPVLENHQKTIVPGFNQHLLTESTIKRVKQYHSAYPEFAPTVILQFAQLPLAKFNHNNYLLKSVLHLVNQVKPDDIAPYTLNNLDVMTASKYYMEIQQNDAFKHLRNGPDKKIFLAVTNGLLAMRPIFRIVLDEDVKMAKPTKKPVPDIPEYQPSRKDVYLANKKTLPPIVK